MHIKRFLTLLFLGTLLQGCGGNDKTTGGGTDTTPSQETPDNNTTNHNTTDNNDSSQNTDTSQTQYTLWECPATSQSENSFGDTFISHNTNDINYDLNTLARPQSVSEIEALFNNAHQHDPTISENIVLPPQSDWDNMSSSQKTLYLINWERCARGLRPFEGIDPTLRDGATHPYAEFIAANQSAFASNPHQADGKSPGDRMANAGIRLGEESEYYSENIATFTLGNSLSYPTVYEPEAHAVYGWLYQDKAEAYGHRKNVLQTGLKDNTGENGTEGLIAAATTTVQEQSEGFFTTKSFVVMDAFDPLPAWQSHMSQIVKVPLYKRTAQ